MCHLLYSSSGVDFVYELPSMYFSHNKIEIMCNEFAGMFLVPDEDFLLQIKEKQIDEINIQDLADIYSVSREEILRKLLQNNLISYETYHNECLKLYSDNLRKKIPDNNSKKNGCNYYNIQMSYKGHHYVELAYNSYYAQKISLPQLSQYMDMRIPAIIQLALNKNWGNI
jgi:Zn-dependent peptidase ImmA (M78 family)